jgi:hypothetical protein
MLAMTLMELTMLTPEDDPPVNAAATLPMTSEIEGRIAPARTAAVVPAIRSNLSVGVRYVKYFVKAIWRVGGATSLLMGEV